MTNRLEILSKQGIGARFSLLVLPVCFLVAAFWAKAAGGPYWLWFNLDPDYFYLLDSLNVLNLTTPGHIYHPGVTVDWLAALILKVRHLGAGADAIAAAVLDDPEPHLRLIGTVFVVINGLGVWGLGAVGSWVFGDKLAAWALQTAPFVSMLVLKNSYHVKPEALLLFTAMMLAVLSVLTLKPGLLDRHRWRFAVGFGVVAGFGVATKITAAPVFLLPLFVLAGGGMNVAFRSIALYGAAALVALIVFALPGLGAYDVFFAWMTKMALGSGAYGGDEGFIDLARYPGNILKLFKRPALHVVFILSGLTLAAAWWRRSPPLPGAEVRLLLGIWVVQLVHVLLVAKQPNPLYLIPSFVLIPTAFVLVWRLGDGLLAGRSLRPGVAVLLALLVAAEGYGVSKLIVESGEKSHLALAVDNDRFGRCARVHAYASSSQSFALMLGDYVTGSRFAGRLAELRPAGDYWLEHWWDRSRLIFRGWRGPEDLSQVLGRYPCAVFRATHWNIIEKLLEETAPGLTFDATCSTGKETILTRGVDCDGRLP